MRLILCYLIAIFCALPAGAEVYKVVDKDGRVTYTDDPPKNAPYEEVDLKPINTQPPVKVQTPSELGTSEPEDEEISYQITLVAPADGAQIPPGQRDLPVEVRLEPGLQGNHRIQFMLDGAPVGRPGATNRTLISEIFRGEHTVSANIIDAEGRVITSSPTATVFVIRPTVRSQGG